ncbi:hypothetical protein T265_07544 [Opisthorchis viverrini]|uniref:Dynein regulatory complex protein 10 n=1 Tax=Opisthorchis viverrini TaxID=6198 RepID=A0A074ZGW8_OPIVI|nr:hypothetical protein T265_07544 [Opisthorchis viverrini]KER24922.1 hypothetical protein T265_07544 [Opisthorchis viverrini]
MAFPVKKASASSDSDERFRRSSILPSLPLLASAPSIQKLSLKHLPTIDSKRFMHVLDNTVTRVLLVSSFPQICSNVQWGHQISNAEICQTVFGKAHPTSIDQLVTFHGLSMCFVYQRIFCFVKSSSPKLVRRRPRVGQSMTWQRSVKTTQVNSDALKPRMHYYCTPPQEYSLLLGRNATVLFETYGPICKAYDEQCAHSKHRPRITEPETNDVHRTSFVTFDEGQSLVSDGITQTARTKGSIALRLFEVTRLLLREMLANPLAISALIRHREQWNIEPSFNCRRLAIQLVHLRSLTRNDLLTTPKARAKRDDFLERLRRRDLEQRKTIEELTSQYKALQETQRLQLIERMERVREIQAKIRDIQEQTQNQLRELKQQHDNERRVAKQKHHRMFILQSFSNTTPRIGVTWADKMMREQEACLQQAAQHLTWLTKHNMDHERHIRMEKWKVEDTIAATLSKTDTELFEMQAEYDELEEEDQKVKAACDELMRKLEPLKVRADAVLEEKRLEAERQAAELEEQENMIRAATTIQSLWRSWKARRQIRAERRKKKGRKH